MKVAIIYDWIDKWGGVERVLLTLSEIYPEADFYTSYFDQHAAHWARNLKVRTSFIQRLPRFIKKSRILSFPFYPYAFESFNFKDYDLVISVTSSFAKSVITRPETRHICYLLTPTRYLWIDYPKWVTPVVPHYKRWDYLAAQRPDKIISISRTVQARCKKYYDRDSDVIYPPLDLEYWSSFKTDVRRQNFFLLVARLEPYKRVDLAIDAFNNMPQERLIIVGDGTLSSKLQTRANRNITFMKDVPDRELASLYSRASALVMPQEEDFGMTAVEAQFIGTPVVAYRAGGATEIVEDGRTGIFFDKQTEKSLIEAIMQYNKISGKLKASTARRGPENMKKFDKSRFIKEFTNHTR